MILSVLLVEDHPIMRETLSELLSDIPEVELDGTAASGEEALSLCETFTPNLALIDVSLPGMNGIELVEALLIRHPETACLMLSGHQENTYIQRAIAAGARGYTLKGDPAEIEKAIQQVIKGGNYVSKGEDDKFS